MRFEICQRPRAAARAGRSANAVYLVESAKPVNRPPRSQRGLSPRVMATNAARV